ncbi:glycosyltransferase family 2 protein [Pseudogemmobacter sonorensis]|uniref:glycosyltransferase family 2 protein n=1 Tax=Pseudogemmobacter sonorensis TaxID=2989681 RepID=UPI0036AF996A
MTAQAPSLDTLRPVSRHGIVTAVSMMKDEGPFVLEWIAHHLAVGFSRIVVYTNDCSDGTDDMLIRLEELGLAHHRRNVIGPGLRPQPSALNHAQDEPLVGESDWVLVFDADEFLCIRYGDGTLDPLLDAVTAQGANGLVITWRIFGSGGVQDWSRAPVTEQYLRAAPKDWNKGWGVKTLFKFDPEHWKLGIHRPKMKNKWLETGYPDGVKWLNGSGRPMEDYFKFRGWRSITRTIGYDWVQMNHYAVKSIDSYAIRKFRGNVNLKKDKYNSDYWSLQDRNETEDNTMLRYSTRRKEIFERLLTDPVLNRLHFAALERVEARLAEYKALPAYAEMVAGLRAAAQRPINEVVAKPPQARDPEKIAALMSRVEKVQSERQAEARKAAGLAPPRGAMLLDTPALAPSPGVAWVANHEVLLPVDPGFFGAQALDLIAAGKFERSLARFLPRLVGASGTHLELGAGCGFRAALLARSRPGLRQVVQEGHPARLLLIEEIWRRNGVRQGPGLQLTNEWQDEGPNGSDLARLLAELRPDSLLIADAAFTPARLTRAIKDSGHRPGTTILAGPCRDDAMGWKEVFPNLVAARADNRQTAEPQAPDPPPQTADRQTWDQQADFLLARPPGPV